MMFYDKPAVQVEAHWRRLKACHEKHPMQRKGRLSQIRPDCLLLNGLDLLLDINNLNRDKRSLVQNKCKRSEEGRNTTSCSDITELKSFISNSKSTINGWRVIWGISQDSQMKFTVPGLIWGVKKFKICGNRCR